MEDNSSSSNPSGISPNNTPSPISNFDETFIEFVHKMSGKAESSTPQGKTESKDSGASSSSMNINRDQSDSDGSTASSVIISGAIQMTSSFSNVSASNLVKAIPNLVKTAAIPVLNKPKSVTTMKIPVKTMSVPVITEAIKWTDFSTLTNGNNQAESGPFLPPPVRTAPLVMTVEDKNKPVVSTNKCVQVKSENIPAKTQQFSFENASVNITPVSTKKPRVITLSGSSLVNAKNIQIKDKGGPVSITPATTTQIVTKPPQIRSLQSPSTLSTENSQPTEIQVTKVQNEFKISRITTSPVPSTSTANVPEHTSVRTKSDRSYKPTSTTVITEGKRITTWRVPSLVGNALFESDSLVIVPVQPARIPVQTAPIPVKTAPIPVKTTPISNTVPFAPLATTSKKCRVKVEASTTILKHDDEENSMEVEYLEDEIPCRGRPKNTGKKRGPLKVPRQTTQKKTFAIPEPPPVKRRPGRPCKPFNFERIITGVRAIRLPNLFWSVNVKRTSTRRQVSFCRAVIAKTFNPVKHDRIVKFTDSIKYSVRIDNRKVKLLAAPPTVNTYKDIQTLLKIVNDIKPHDPMLEYF